MRRMRHVCLQSLPLSQANVPFFWRGRSLVITMTITLIQFPRCWLSSIPCRYCMAPCVLDSRWRQLEGGILHR